VVETLALGISRRSCNGNVDYFGHRVFPATATARNRFCDNFSGNNNHVTYRYAHVTYHTDHYTHVTYHADHYTHITYHAYHYAYVTHADHYTHITYHADHYAHITYHAYHYSFDHRQWYSGPSRN
jgi:hypothetical protein